MKKIFFVAALAFSATLMAQESINWYDVVEPLNSIEVGTTCYENVQVNEAGDIFLHGTIGSVGMDPHAIVMDDTVATVAFKENQSNTNTAPFFIKLNEAGDVQWMVVSNDGQFKSHAGLALADGGMLVAATAHQSQASVISFASHYTPANTAKYEQPKTQYGLLLKIAANGKPAILTKIEQAETGKTDGIAFNNIVTDGTDYYVLARLKSKVSVAGTELAPSEAGACLAIMKFNASGAYKGALLTDGVSLTSSTAKLVYANSKLYLVSNFKGTTANTLTLGSASVAVPNALNNIAVFEANTDLTGSAIHVIEGYTSGGKNSMTTYGIVATDSALYISGFYMGGITTADGALNNETKQNAAFVVKYDLNSNTATRGLMMKDGTGICCFQTDGLLAKGDSLYAYYYDWTATGDRIFLQAMDGNLKLGSRIGLINTASMTTTRGAAFHGDNLIYTAYIKGVNTLSADNSINFNTSAFRGLVVSQKVINKTATPAPAAHEQKQNINKQINNGNVYILSNDDIYTVTGSKVK
ncbi:MAG: hypothetical protein K6A36_02885 [Paludibacteraceae bacterium]|nr:hypothetical protein [Paludibacteraceae bacterium]